MQFKKTINVFLAITLLLSNIGFAYTIHYCDDKIASVSLNTVSNINSIEKSCCEQTETQSKCCKNKIVKSVEKSDQIISKIISFNLEYNLFYCQFYNSSSISKVDLKNKKVKSYYCNANAPPLYLLYSQYTFYS